MFFYVFAPLVSPSLFFCFPPSVFSTCLLPSPLCFDIFLRFCSSFVGGAVSGWWFRCLTSQKTDRWDTGGHFSDCSYMLTREFAISGYLWKASGMIFLRVESVFRTGFGQLVGRIFWTNSTGWHQDKKLGKKRKGLTFLRGLKRKTWGKTSHSHEKPPNIEKLRGSLS